MRLSEYQDAALRTAIYPGRGSMWGLTYVTLKLNGEAGEVAEKVGKTIRDDNLRPCSLPHEMNPERYEKIIDELGDTLWYVAAAADELGVPLDVIAHRNLAKLEDRRKRGVLGGDGDRR